MRGKLRYCRESDDALLRSLRAEDRALVEAVIAAHPKLTVAEAIGDLKEAGM